MIIAGFTIFYQNLSKIAGTIRRKTKSRGIISTAVLYLYDQTASGAAGAEDF